MSVRDEQPLEWFSPVLDRAARDLIESVRPQAELELSHSDAARYVCNLAAGAWARALSGQSVHVAIVYGAWDNSEAYGEAPPTPQDVIDDGDDLACHWWLELDGAIFDPTAGQFHNERGFNADERYIGAERHKPERAFDQSALGAL
jgi:hypothetical protein